MISLRVPGLLAYRDIAMRAVSGACKLAVASSESTPSGGARFVHEFVSAFGEAFNNVVLHSYDGVPPGEILVDVEWDRYQIRAELRDEGKSFEPDDVPSPNLESLPESGMGLFIIRAFVDDIEYEPGPPNVLRIRKRFASNS